MALGLSAAALRAAVEELGAAACRTTAEACTTQRALFAASRRALRAAPRHLRCAALTRHAAPRRRSRRRYAAALMVLRLPSALRCSHRPRRSTARAERTCRALRWPRCSWRQVRCAAPRRIACCGGAKAAEALRSRVPTSAALTRALRAAAECPFADVVDALLPLLQPGPAGDVAAVPTQSPSWSFLRRGSRPSPTARALAPAPPPAYAYISGLCPAPPPSAAAARARPGGCASGAAAAVEAEDDAALRAFTSGLRAAGSLLLVLPPWAAEAPPGGRGCAEQAAAVPPPLLRCPNCLLALLAARTEGARVTFIMPPRGAAWLERVMLRGGYSTLHQSLLRLDAAAAFAGADAASRAFVARHGGFEAVDAAARAAASAALLDAACAILLRGDAAPLTGHRLRAGTGMAVAARHVAEHCAAMGRLQPAERLLRVALASVRAQPGANAPAAQGGDAHEVHLGILADLAAVLQAQGQLTEAQKVLRGAVDRARAWRGPKHAFTLAAEAQLQHVQQAAGELCLRHFARIATATRS